MSNEMQSSTRLPQKFYRALRGKLKNFFNNTKEDIEESYSQAGEDRIIHFLMQVMRKSSFSYLDIGANNPKKLSNTYFFYRLGYKGVCVEPNPILWRTFSKVRPRDITMNVGIADNAKAALPFYRFGPEADGLSTFSEEQAKFTEADQNFKIQEVIQIPVVSVNSIMVSHFESPPTLLSIDVEGLDREILDSLDFQKYAPMIICAETHSQANGNFSKDKDYISFICDKGYTVYADTFINTIFLRNEEYNIHFSIGD